MESIEKLVKVKAPISGTIISIPVRVGDVMGENQALFTIAQINKMVAKVQATDRELVQIKKGMTVQAFWNGIEYRGVVSDIGMEMNSMSRSFPIEITIDNPKQTLKSGVTVDVRIKVKETDQAIVIDRKLLVDEASKKYVYLEKGGIAIKRQVQTGIASGTNIEIIDGLKLGDNLITCCTSFLEDGIKIKLNK
jgi:RND family efflux transporter MFP subunit